MTEKEILPVKTLKPNDCAAPALTVLGHWNSKSNIKVKHVRPDAKVYGESLRSIELLLNGTFCHQNRMDPDFLEDQCLYQEELNKSWTESELITAIDRHDYKCSASDTSKFPRSFPDFCYNPRTRYSFLFSVIGNRRPNGMPEPAIKPWLVDLYNNRLDMWRDNQITMVQSVNYIIRAFDKLGLNDSPARDSYERAFHESFIRYLWQGWRDRDYFSPKLIVVAYSVFDEWLQKNEIHWYRLFYERSTQAS